MCTCPAIDVGATNVGEMAVVVMPRLVMSMFMGEVIVSCPNCGESV